MECKRLLMRGAMNEIGDIENTLNWWREAGADVLVADEPRGWLKEPKADLTPVRPRPEPAAEAKPAKPVVIPEDLGELRRFLLETDDLPLPHGPRFDAEGDPSAGLMILLAMPETQEAEDKGLLPGDTGLLFDRMLAAIGRDRASVYLATLSPVRGPGGTLDDALVSQLGEIAKKHVGLAAPKRLIVMGNAPSRVFCGADLAEARTLEPIVNHNGGTVPVTATFHPRFLLQHPGFKAESWKDLQILIEGQTA